jgi:integrase
LALFVYTRHVADCPKKSDRFWRRCHCPKWLRGVLNGRPFRKSAATRSWERAEARCRRLELQAEQRAQAAAFGEAAPVERAPITVEAAVARFLLSKKNENLAESTLEKLKTIFEKHFVQWARSEAFAYLAEITVADLELFRDTWKDRALAKKKKQERLVGFFYYCMRMGWVKQNPAVMLGRIRAEGPPTDYFPKAEFAAIIDATYVYQPKGWKECRQQATRLRILTWLMRWSGLAIRDAVTLERSRLSDRDELLLYRAKTGTPVYVPLPPHVADALRSIPPGPKPNPRYFFWSGNGSPKTLVGDWQRSYRRLFKISDLRLEDSTPKRCHPHMFRDTFAVEMLLAGVPLEQVSMLLGHKSVKITEKHYAPWVKARQDQLSMNVRKAWAVIEGKQARSAAKKPPSSQTA